MRQSRNGALWLGKGSKAPGWPVQTVKKTETSGSVFRGAMGTNTKYLTARIRPDPAW